MWGASIRAKLATVVPSVTKEAAGTSSSTATKSNINQKNSNISYIDVAKKKNVMKAVSKIFLREKK